MGETERERGMRIGELGNYRNREGEGNGMGTEWERGNGMGTREWGM
jgi:hypothetical protein